MARQRRPLTVPRSEAELKLLQDEQRTPEAYKPRVGSPIKRQRRAADGEPGFPVTQKPADWVTFKLINKLEAAWGCSIDRVMDYLSWPPERCNPHMLSAQKEAALTMIKIYAKIGIEAARREERGANLEALAEKVAMHRNRQN